MTFTEMSRIDRSIEINAPPERVWRALTKREELSAWFQMGIEGEIAEGSEVWMTTTHPDYKGMRFQVKFLEMRPPTLFVWEWHPGAVDPNVDYTKEPRTKVTFTLQPNGAGTHLTVSETGFDAITLERRAKVYKDNTQGWAEVVVWLRDYAEKAH
ncbi:SRPBCC family protein [uncultured Paludibaculum sp.]|uniref:SRPBCC family protein n=1 Tax=uncultured Paludibaculum sp. TaxID=1765020 RepID=UPI002AAB13D6|nr:SRPBCC family protein [uncultured Paludibaculum sp.]